MLVSCSCRSAVSFADHVFEGSDGQLYEIRHIGGDIHISGNGYYHKVFPGRTYNYHSARRGYVALYNKISCRWLFHLVPDDVTYRCSVHNVDYIGFNTDRNVALMADAPRSMLVWIDYNNRAEHRKLFINRSISVGVNADALLVSSFTRVGADIYNVLTEEVVHTIKPFLFGLRRVWFTYPVTQDTAVLGVIASGNLDIVMVRSNSIIFRCNASISSVISSKDCAVIYARDNKWQMFAIYADLKTDSFCILKGVKEVAIISNGLAVKPHSASVWYIIGRDELNRSKIGYIELSPIGQSPVYVVQSPLIDLSCGVGDRL